MSSLPVRSAARRRGAWPPHTGRALELATRKVRDLTDDPQLRELLAAECARYAAKRWTRS